jgi:hypothetical protein
MRPNPESAYEPTLDAELLQVRVWTLADVQSPTLRIQRRVSVRLGHAREWDEGGSDEAFSQSQEENPPMTPMQAMERLLAVSQVEREKLLSNLRESRLHQCCFHVLTGPIWMVLQDGHVPVKCCGCDNSKTMHREHLGEALDVAGHRRIVAPPEVMR